MNARRRSVRLIPGLALLATSPIAFGQTTGTTQVILAPTSVPAPAVSTQPPQAVAPAAAPAASPPAPEVVKPGELPANVFAKTKPDPQQAAHLQKIQQLGFDRRPSSILRAWANPEAPKPDATKTAGPTTTNPAATPTAPPTPADPFDADLAAFRRLVTRGDWPAVAKALAALPEAEGSALYRRLIAALPTSTDDPNAGGANLPPDLVNRRAMLLANNGGQPMGNPQFGERTVVNVADVIALAEAAPHGRERDVLAGLANLLRLAIDRGDSIENFVAQVRAARGVPGRQAATLTDREAARVLMASGNPVEAKVFLPEPERAEADNDREALNLLSRHYLAIHAKEKKAEYLERAWRVTLAVLAVGEVDAEQKEEALKRAVELSPRVRDDLGNRWLEESFTRRPERGKEIIAAIGTASSRGLQTNPADADGRFRALELQKTAVEALLRSDAGRTPSPTWDATLTLLAGAWLAEADFAQRYDTSTSLGPRMQRDIYGNFFYLNNGFDNQQMMMQRQGNFPLAVPVARVLQVMPDPAWLTRVDPGLRPKYAATIAQLYLKVGEDEKAFPFVESLATTHPERAREQAEEFLRVWTRNHDPNAERNLRNPYIYMYGFERKAESIPLTRSKQERNLKELAAWVARLRKLPIRQLDESLIARAFTACHSAAEVYRLDAIEAVLGTADGLKPETLAEMAQQMRTNLVGLWRAPAVQDQNKTKRKEKDIRAEVLRGYEVARSVVDRGLQRHPGHWGLALAHAALRHDENAYRQEIDPSAEFAKRRNLALDEFRAAAQLYAAKVPSLSEDEETTAPFESWFYAGLGACDLGAINEKNFPDPRQPALIRQAILALPADAAQRHLGKFANALFTRMSALNPAVKFRYLKGGFEIVGDHEQAVEARKVYDYYKDLVTEIKLDAIVDGPAEVGSGRPFGLFVNLRHTRDIERESGGFGRYLQNQNQGMSFAYNYGRPLENYRDKFQDAAKKVLEEHFEILSVTFQDDKVNSRATAEYGWRYTPYAYLLLKAKSPKVDKVPPLRLDLDFLDTSGYVVLPVETPTVPIECATMPLPRPFDKLEVTQTLDERQAKDGKLILEVKAVARGLVPPLDQILDLGQNADFRPAKTEDQGLSVSRFDPDAEANAVVAEQSWLITYEAAADRAEQPTRFTFPEPRLDATTTFQRYVDADLAKVGPEVDLEARYGEPKRLGYYWAAAVVLMAVGLSVLAWLIWPRPTGAPVARFAVPDPITPFSVLGLLRAIQRHDGLSDSKRLELAAAIQRLEAHYFADGRGDHPDLAQVATTWIGQAT